MMGGKRDGARRFHVDWIRFSCVKFFLTIPNKFNHIELSGGSHNIERPSFNDEYR